MEAVPQRTRPLVVPLLIIAAIVVAIDQATKVIVVNRLTEGESVRAIDGILYWTLQRNPGSAFGLFRHFPVAFTILASAIAIGILVGAHRVRDRLTAVALGLVLGGAIGNLVDRIVRPPGVFRGHVVDFIDFRVWPVFNIADSCVVVGVVLLLVASWRAERRVKTSDAATA
jgi:signal peptidase II